MFLIVREKEKKNIDKIYQIDVCVSSIDDAQFTDRNIFVRFSDIIWFELRSLKFSIVIKKKRSKRYYFLIFWNPCHLIQEKTKTNRKERKEKTKQKIMWVLKRKITKAKITK